MPTVLIVEDDAPLRELTSSIVGDLGYRPLSAAGPREALELARHSTIDILMTDLEMEGDQRAGLQLARAIRAVRPDIPVIYTTGGGLSAAERRLFVDAAGLLPKPYRMAQLQAALNGAIAA